MTRHLSARQRAARLPISTQNMPGVLKGLLPRQSNFTSPNYPELLGELNRFGIKTRKQLRAMVLRHRREAIRIDREPLDEVNTRIFRNEMGDKEFAERIRTNTWFSWEAFVRIILELHFGDEYRAFAKERDGTGA